MLSTVAPWNVWNHKHYRIQFQFRVKKESSPKVILFYASITNSTRSLSVATSTWCRTKFSSWDKIVNNLMVCSCQDLKIIITQRLIVTLYNVSIGRSRYNYPKRILNRQHRQGWIRTRGGRLWTTYAQIERARSRLSIEATRKMERKGGRGRW